MMKAAALIAGGIVLGAGSMALAQTTLTPEQARQVSDAAYDWVCSNPTIVKPWLYFTWFWVFTHVAGFAMKRLGVHGTKTVAGWIFAVLRTINADAPPPKAVIAQQAGAILSDPVKGPAVLAAINADPVAKEKVIAGALATSALSKP